MAPLTAHVVDLEQIERLTDKLKGLIGLLERTRNELAQTVDDNGKLQLEVSSLRTQLTGTQSSQSEVAALLAEREQVRARVETMLQQLDAINL